MWKERSAAAAHPDLTAMLDVVMQMLLYFIMCARFLHEQAGADVLLPLAQSARPLVQGEGDAAFITLDAAGRIVPRPGDPPLGPAQAGPWLDRLAALCRTDGQVRAAVVLRAHRDAPYGDVYRILEACKDRGFRQFKLRTTQSGVGG